MLLQAHKSVGPWWRQAGWYWAFFTVFLAVLEFETRLKSLLAGGLVFAVQSLLVAHIGRSLFSGAPGNVQGGVGSWLRQSPLLMSAKFLWLAGTGYLFLIVLKLSPLFFVLGAFVYLLAASAWYLFTAGGILRYSPGRKCGT